MSNLHQAQSLSGIAAYGVAPNLPMIALTEIEYYEILRGRQQQSLVLPHAREAAIMQSARLQQQLAASNMVGNLAADGYPRQFPREADGVKSAPDVGTKQC